MRARDLGIEIGLGTPGPLNAITDVAGVRVGAVTLVEGDGPLAVGKGPVRTGVTVIVPHEGEISEEPLFAGCHTLNGNGELTGLEWVRESGLLMSPVALTNTHSVGVVRDALVRREVEARGPGKLYWSVPHVGETWDGYLNDVGGQHVRAEHVAEALARAAGGPVPEGNAGGGTGMICHDFKGGTGTASRVVELAGERFTVAALVQANHSSRAVFSVNGVPVGQILDDAAVPLPVAPEEAAGIAGAAGRKATSPSGPGSIIVVIATDAPLLPVQLRRVAQRAGMGLAYLGAYGDHFSGDIFLAFSIANRGIPRQDYEAAGPVRLRAEWVSLPHFDALLQASAEATAEAILNAMLQAETMVGRDGVTAHALDGPRLVEILDRYGRRTFRP
ncbi:MAG: P1 family peptidase [Thermoleophilia bacterium]|nr:P1 family peptidase [Thermoleophilia bacterium]